MKKNILKTIAISIFAFSMAFGAGSFLAHAKVNSCAEIVLAEGEETPEEGEETTPEEGEETPSESEETPKEDQSTGEESKSAASSSAGPKDFLKAIAKAFRDALLDLKAHLKRWFHK